MKARVLQENLIKALTRTNRILPARPQLPILSNILVEAKEGGLRLVATNMETSEVVAIGAKIEKEGGLCAPSRLLTELVASLPADTVTLESLEGSLLVSCADTRASLPGAAASEFPPVSAQKPVKARRFTRADLMESLSLVLFAAATDEGRPLLTGVRLVQDAERLTLAATDGYRLSVKRLSADPGEAIDMVVPARALGELLLVLQEEKEGETISMSVSAENQLLFSAGNTNIITRLIDGDYPAYDKTIPSSFTTRVQIEKSIFTRAVKSAAVFARDNANIIRLTIENQKLTVAANTPQVGENRIEITTKVDGDGGSIAFNSRFLLEFLHNFPYEEFLFEMTGSLNPGLFKPIKDDSFLHVIMPVRLQNEAQ